jgi:hypothetical protein
MVALKLLVRPCCMPHRTHPQNIKIFSKLEIAGIQKIGFTKNY